MSSGRDGAAGDDTGSADRRMAGQEASPVVAIVLAAGSSTRFGGRKLLAEIDGMPLIRHTVSRILESQVNGVSVVVGAGAAEIRGALAGLGVAFTPNPDHAAGMGTSIAAGVRALPADVDAAVIVLGDQPVPADLINALVGEHRAGRGPIVIPEYEGVRGPPALFGRPCFDALEALEGDTGARAFIAENPALVRVLRMSGAAPPDVDTRLDLRSFDADR